MATHCGCVRPGEPHRVAAHELDGEALDRREDQEPAERPPAGLVVPRRQAPQDPDDEGHDDDLVDRRGMDPDAGRRGHGALGISHRPREVGRPAVVAVAGELAADAPDGVTQSDRGGRGIGDDVQGDAADERPGDHAEKAADEAAVPGEADAAEGDAPEVGLHRRPVLDEVVDARARGSRRSRRPR